MEKTHYFAGTMPDGAYSAPNGGHEGVTVDMVAWNKRANEIHTMVQDRTPEQKAEALEKRKALAALGGVAELNSLEGEYYDLTIYRDSPVLDFVEMRDLPLGSVAFFRTRYAPPVGFYMGSVNAMGSSYYYATSDYGQQVTPFVVQTDEVMIPNINFVYDMNRLEQRTKGLERLGYFLKEAMVNIALNTMFGASDVVGTDPATALTAYAAGGGSFAGKNVYVLDPGVIAAGVPTVNFYNIQSAQTTAMTYGLDKICFETINDWRIQIGRNIRKIIVSRAPSSGSGKTAWRGMLDQASPVALVSSSGVANPAYAIPPDRWSEMQNEDFSKPVALNWFGLNVTIEAQNWMPAGYVLVLTDQPSVIMWDRLSLATGEDRAGTLEVPVSGYMSRRSEARQIATVRPDYTLRNWLLLEIE